VSWVKILLIDDDQNLAMALQKDLATHRYSVDIALDGEQGWALLEIFAYDLILLDLYLPKLDGISLCRRIRTEQSSAATPNYETPILLLTQEADTAQKVVALDAGADDYVIKPVSFSELLARIRALLRRSVSSGRSPKLHWGDLELDPRTYGVTYRQRSLSLTPKEYALLELFLRNPNQLFKLTMILERLWSSENPPSDWAVRSHMKALRQKLKQAGAPELFETQYRLGYRLKPLPSESAPQPISSQPLERFADPNAGLLLPALQTAWLDCRESYLERLVVIQQAVVALEQGAIDPPLQRLAHQEAHTLAGSLGSFGLTQATVLATRIQRLLGQTVPTAQVPRLAAWVEQLQQAMNSNAPMVNDSPSTGPDGLEATLLIVDDDMALVRLLEAETLSWGMHPHVATTLPQAWEQLQQHPPDVILLDIRFPHTTESGLDFLARVQEHYPTIPVVILTILEDFSYRMQAAQLGSRIFLRKPLAAEQILATVAQLLQQANVAPAHLLIVDHDLQHLSQLQTMLQPYGYRITLLQQPQRFWAVLEQTAPDALMMNLDLSIPPEAPPLGASTLNRMTGLDLCRVVRCDPQWQRLPILLFSDTGAAEALQSGVAAGANDVLAKPVVAADLLARLQHRLEQRASWSGSAAHFPLAALRPSGRELPNG
jgi:DNA-binding response OmpR family regulator